MKTNYELVEYAKSQLGRPYIYGTYGCILTEPLLLNKARQYPSYLSNKRVEYAKKHYIGQKCHDCYGLYKGFLWSKDADSNAAYTPSQDISADVAFQRATEKGSIKTIPEVPGIAVRYSGHFGIYIGNGEVIEARGFDYGVVRTLLSERKWTHWFYLPEIDYLEKEEPLQESKTGLPIEGVTYKVTAKSGLNIRKGRGTNFLKCGAYNYGQKIVVFGIVNGWAETDKGYVCADYITRC